MPRWSAGSWAVGQPWRPLDILTSGKAWIPHGWMTWSALAWRPPSPSAALVAGKSITATMRKTRESCAQVVPGGNAPMSQKKGFIQDWEVGTAGGTSVMGMTLQGSWGGGKGAGGAGGTWHARPSLHTWAPSMPLSVCSRGRRGRLTPFALPHRHKPLAATVAGRLQSLRRDG